MVVLLPSRCAPGSYYTPEQGILLNDSERQAHSNAIARHKRDEHTGDSQRVARAQMSFILGECDCPWVHTVLILLYLAQTRLCACGRRSVTFGASQLRAGQFSSAQDPRKQAN